MLGQFRQDTDVIQRSPKSAAGKGEAQLALHHRSDSGEAVAQELAKYRFTLWRVLLQAQQDGQLTRGGFTFPVRDVLKCRGLLEPFGSPGIVFQSEECLAQRHKVPPGLGQPGPIRLRNQSQQGLHDFLSNGSCLLPALLSELGLIDRCGGICGGRSIHPPGCVRRATPDHPVRLMGEMDWAWISGLCSISVVVQQGGFLMRQLVNTRSTRCGINGKRDN
jgi:hypothetical protein